VFTPTLRHLFHPDNLGEYLESIRAGSDHLATTLGRVSGPSTGTSPGQAAAPIAEIDLDAPSTVSATP
jgi:L-2,4-diaminobutyrate decarboxylase